MEAQLPSQPHPGLEAARRARAAGPAADAEALRRAYLDLLKLCLCDLAGAGTTSVGRTEDGQVMSRELSGEGLRLRAAGMDWPLQGLTMIGLRRLDDLQACVESVVANRIDGDLIEAGAWRGGASILMRATLDSLGADQRSVWVADSFQGFPSGAAAASRTDGEPDDLGVFDFLAVPLAEVKANFARFGCQDGVNFVPGFFEDTMPDLGGRRWSIVHLDADTYEATLLTLRHLYPGLSAGGYLIVDDYGALDECARAVDEFRREEGIAEPLEEVDWTGIRWRRESDPAAASHQGRDIPRSPRRQTSKDVVDRHPTPIPTVREIELERELAALRERLDVAETEIERLRSSPLRGALARLRKARRP
jgi:O-methyltransferase